MRRVLFSLLLATSGCVRAPLHFEKPSDGSMVVVAAGDISGEIISGQKHTAELVEGLRPDAVLVLGDAQYPEGALADYQRHYGPTWGRFKALTWPVPGNHEYKSGAVGYFAYFGERAADPTQGYYSFELGDWHVVALNTNHDCLVVGCDAESEQVKWLEADLAASPKKCTLAFWHHPRFNSGAHSDFVRASAIWKLLDQHHVELVLNGHEHFYERIGPVDQTGAKSETGIVQFTVGTGGIGFSPIAKVHPSSVVRQNDTLGVLRLRLGAADWETDFVSVPGTSFLDHAAGLCR